MDSPHIFYLIQFPKVAYSSWHPNWSAQNREITSHRLKVRLIVNPGIFSLFLPQCDFVDSRWACDPAILRFSTVGLLPAALWNVSLPGNTDSPKWFTLSRPWDISSPALLLRGGPAPELVRLLRAFPSNSEKVPMAGAFPPLWDLF